MICQVENVNEVSLKEGDVIKSRNRFTSFRVTSIGKESLEIKCDKYFYLGDLTLSILETFNALKKMYGVSYCNFIVKNYGIIKIDSNVSAQSLHTRIINRMQD